MTGAALVTIAAIWLLSVNAQENKHNPGGPAITTNWLGCVVVGKEDFYFGPQRLREIARRLSGDDSAHPVWMLGSNLIVKTSYRDEQTKIPDAQKRLQFTPGLPDGIEVVEIKDHGVVLPYLQWITLRVDTKVVKDLGTLNPAVPEAATAQNPDDLTYQKGDVLTQCKSDECTVQEPHTQDKPDEEKSTIKLISFHMRDLKPGKNYGLCFPMDIAQPKAEKNFCARFSVAEPFLSRPRKQSASDHCSTPDYACPYWFHTESSGEKIVVFGVLDPDFSSLVGRDNVSWKNDNSELKTEVAAIDPTQALAQAIQLFVAKKVADLSNSRLRKVLLAEMEKGKAEEFATQLPFDVLMEKGKPETLVHLPFDVVIARANDYRHATAAGTVTLTLNADPQLKSEKQTVFPYHTPVLVPWKTYDPHWKPSSVMNPLRSLEIQDQDHAPHRTITVSGDYESWKLPDYESRSSEAVKSTYTEVAKNFLGCDNKPKCGGTEPFVTAVLSVMRQATHTDIALLQKRDFYWGPFAPSERSGQEIERILWSGNLVRVLHVTGKTLQKVLKESDAFDEADRQTVNANAESNRGLVALGVEPTDDDNYIVGGALLDKNRVYTIATSNHITAGDTGYPELKNPDDPELADTDLPTPPTRKAGALPTGREAEGMRISELACNYLPLQGPGILAQDRACVTPDPQNTGKGVNGLFASAKELPPERTPTLATRARVWALNSLNRELISSDTSTTERKAQDHPSWVFSLQQLSLQYQLTTNNLSEAERQNLFTGFTEPGIGGQDSHSWTNTLQWQTVHGGRWLDEYARTQFEYSSSVIKSVPPALTSVSRDKNRGQVDVGFYVHPFTFCHYFLPLCENRRKEYPKSGFVFEPFRIDTPLAHEIADIASTSQTPQRIKLGRTQRILMRTGIRAEDTKSHLEMGFEGGWQRGSLVSINTSAGDCAPIPSESFGTCLGNLVPPVTDIVQVRHTHLKEGFYLDWGWQTPLPLKKDWTYQIQAQGDWFPFTRSEENSSDTRYRYDFVHTFKIPVWASLSFQPAVEYFHYRNEFGTSSLKRWSPSAKLTWSFDRYSGESWWKAIRHSPGGAGDQ